jgi:hypothetical protein
MGNSVKFPPIGRAYFLQGRQRAVAEARRRLKTRNPLGAVLIAEALAGELTDRPLDWNAALAIYVEHGRVGFRCFLQGAGVAEEDLNRVLQAMPTRPKVAQVVAQRNARRAGLAAQRAAIEGDPDS